jgi:hypothetical protein
MIKNLLVFCTFFIIIHHLQAQPASSKTNTVPDCNCEKQLNDIAVFMETNYVGFADKQKQIAAPVYARKVAELKKMAKKPGAKEKCLMIINSYLSIFRDQHVGISLNFDATLIDSNYARSKEIIPVSPAIINKLRQSKGIEGLYISTYDSAYTIAVIKQKTAISDYVGIITETKLPHWKKGQVKLILKQVNDSLLKGVLYMRNHQPKIDYFYVAKNRIGGDWLRQGAEKKAPDFRYVPVDAKPLSDKTFYIKIASFEPSNWNRIDSLFKLYDSLLKKTPNLVLDLRNNGGGSDFAYGPILPLIYTRPVKTIGVDVLSTDVNINGWKAVLDDPDIPETSRKSIEAMIAQMEAGKGKLVNIAPDETDSSFTVLPYPQKVVVLVNENCASTTEQFLLAARQSSKVILAGQATQGVLDYSNVRTAPFSCMPYILRYSTTRSRRVDMGQGIDNKGIKPDYYFLPATDWITEAVKLVEK